MDDRNVAQDLPFPSSGPRRLFAGEMVIMDGSAGDSGRFSIRLIVVGMVWPDVR